VLADGETTVLVVDGLSALGMRIYALAGYAVLLPGVFDQPFITFLDWVEDHGRRRPPVLLPTRVVSFSDSTRTSC
jgi:hypothetical protein